MTTTPVRISGVSLLPPVGSSLVSQSWAMLIKRVYEVDPLSCPECGGQMKVVSFIEPPQGDVIEEILRHCGLWQSQELTYVDIDTFLDRICQRATTLATSEQIRTALDIRKEKDTLRDPEIRLPDRPTAPSKSSKGAAR